MANTTNAEVLVVHVARDVLQVMQVRAVSVIIICQLLIDAYVTPNL